MKDGQEEEKAMDKNEEIIKLLKEYNQEHIIELLSKLNEEQKEELIEQLKNIDFHILLLLHCRIIWKRKKRNWTKRK